MRNKRIVLLLCAASMLISLSSCGSKQSDDESNKDNESKVVSDTSKDDNSEDIANTEEESNAEVIDVSSEVSEQEENSSNEEESSADTIDQLSATVEKDVEDTVASLTSKYEQLKSEVDTYDKFLTSTDKIEKFYSDVYEEHNALCIRLYEYSLKYAEKIVPSGKSFDDKYDELEEIFDVVYDEAGETVYDEIYDGILDDIYDDFYDGILDDAYDTAEFKEWNAARSDEFKRWNDARSDVFDDWSDCRSDIYDFYTDVRGEIFSEDMEGALKKMNKFSEDISKLK